MMSDERRLILIRKYSNIMCFSMIQQQIIPTCTTILWISMPMV